ncbi:MAG: hypothetical protein Q9160_007975 [Pyrenula sp. 1 TL-2023]
MPPKGTRGKASDRGSRGTSRGSRGTGTARRGGRVTRTQRVTRGRGAARGQGSTREEQTSRENTSEDESPARTESEDAEEPQLGITLRRPERRPAVPRPDPFLQTMMGETSSAATRVNRRNLQPPSQRPRLAHITVPLPETAVRQVTRREMRPAGWQPLAARTRTAHPPDSYRLGAQVLLPGDNDYIPPEGRDRQEQQTTVLATPEEREAERVRLIRQATHDLYVEERSAISRLSALPTEDVYPTEPATSSPRQENRIETLRDIVRLPHLIGRETLVEVLKDTDWDVIEAAARLRRRDRNSRITDPLAPVFPGLPRYTEHPRGASLNRGRGGTPVQTSRRAVLAALLVRVGHQANAPLPHENTTIIAFLHAHQWDLERAVEAYHVNGGNLDEYRRYGATLRSRNPTQYQRDQRLAEFLSWVSIDSLHSAREHLKRHNWDVARAVDEWVRLGHVPILRPSAARDRTSIWPPQSQGMRSVSVEYGPDNDDLYRHDDAIPDSESYDFGRQGGRIADPNPAWANTTTEQPENDGNPPEYSDKRDRNNRFIHRQGFIIDENRHPPLINCPNPTKLRDEIIHRGEYHTVWHFPGFDRRGGNQLLLRWLDSDSDDEKPNAHHDRPEFDWRTSHRHVKRLTQDRNQFFLRETTVPVRDAVIPYHELELQWLWERTSREVERWAQMYRVNTLAHGRGLPPTFPAAVKMAWEADYNLRFHGQTTVDGVRLGNTPRPWRSGRTLVVQLGRMENVVEDFLVARNRPYQRMPAGQGQGRGQGGRRQRRRLTRQERESESEDEGEEEEESEETEASEQREEEEEEEEEEEDVGEVGDDEEEDEPEDE